LPATKACRERWSAALAACCLRQGRAWRDRADRRRDAIEDALRLLRDEHEYQQLMEIAGVDYPERAERFEVVYMLLSLTKNHRIMVKVSAAEDTPVPTVTTLWPVAGWLEREVFDMFGVICSPAIPTCAAS
jgi:NADH:ubiquinone oxidoreductase subunit C